MELEIKYCKKLERTLADLRQELENLKREATGEEVEEEERKGEPLRRAIEGTLPMMVNGSQWFSIAIIVKSYSDDIFPRYSFISESMPSFSTSLRYFVHHIIWYCSE